MSIQTIITISRQFGSGGHEIGQLLSNQLDIPCYDKKLIELASKTSGIQQAYFENAEEHPPSSFLYSLSLAASAANPFLGNSDFTLSEQIFKAQAKAIRDAAAQGACVIVGRCADYILENTPYCLHVYIHSGLEERVKRISSRFEADEKTAKEMIQKVDKKRKSYYQFYVDDRWGNADRYDLCLNSGTLGIERCVKLIIDAVTK